MEIEPLNDCIVLEQIKAKEKSDGGILLPEQAQRKPNRGEVLAVGPGKINEHTGQRIAVGVSTGDEILFGDFAGHQIEFEGRKFLVIRGEDVIGRIKK